jgi:hypothetical protein
VYICNADFRHLWLRVYLFGCLFGFFVLPCVLLFYQYSRIIYIIHNLNPAQYRATLNRSMKSSSSDSHTETTSFINKKINFTSKVSMKVYSDEAERKQVEANQRKTGQLKPSRDQHKQTTKMLFLMMILFFISILPLRIFSIWVIYATREDLHSLGIENYYNLLSFVRNMYYIHSSLNPILYHVLSTKFRIAFRNTFSFKWICKTKA